MIKKIIALMLTIVLALSASPFSVMAAPDGATPSVINVIVNGKALVFDQTPVMENGRVLVPLRTIFEALGADVEWNDSTQTVTAAKDNITVTLTIGSDTLIKNGTNIKLDVPAKIIGGRTMVPARAVSESFGAEVGWDQNSQTVTIGQNMQQAAMLPMSTPININGYSTSITGIEIKDRLHNKSPISGEMVYEIKFDPGSTQVHDPFIPLATGSELIDKNGNRYRYSGSQFGNGRHYNLQFAVPVTAGDSGFAFYWNGQTMALSGAVAGEIPDTNNIVTPPAAAPSSPSAFPTEFDVVKGDNYFQIHSLPGNNYNATAEYFIYVGDYRGKIDFKVTLSPTSFKDTLIDYWDTTDAEKDAAYVRLRLGFQITPTNYTTTVNNKLTIKIGDWTYTDTLPVNNGTLHSIQWY